MILDLSLNRNNKPIIDYEDNSNDNFNNLTKDYKLFGKKDIIFMIFIVIVIYLIVIITLLVLIRIIDYFNN